MQLLKSIIIGIILAMGVGGIGSVASASENYVDYRLQYELELTQQEITYLESLYPNLSVEALRRLEYLYKKRDYLLYCIQTNAC